MASSYRVTFITGEYPPMVGGIADYTEALAAALAERNVHVEILTSIRAGSASTHVHPTVHSWAVPALPFLLRQTALTRPDVVHMQYQAAAFDLHGGIHLLPGLLRSLGGPAAVVTFHDLRIPYLFPRAGPLREFVNCVLARSVDGVITTNDEDRQAITDLGVPNATVFAIPLGQNVPPMAHAPSPLAPLHMVERGAPPEAGRGEAPVVGFFGLINRSKGLGTLVDAIAVLHRIGQPVRLCIIGSGVGSSDTSNVAYAAELKAKVSQLELGPYVEFVGPLSVPELSSALRSCDVLALPFEDGASLRRTTLLAALAHGVPTVTTRPRSPLALSASGATADSHLALGDEAVRFVTPGSVGELTAALGQLLRNPAQRRALGARGAVATANLRWEVIAKAHETVHRCALSLARSNRRR